MTRPEAEKLIHAIKLIALAAVDSSDPLVPDKMPIAEKMATRLLSDDDLKSTALRSVVEFYKVRLSEAREVIVRALTQLREHTPGAAVETLEDWLSKDKAL
jgi:alanine-alpha-ketoisovalerate/valine-pyruvate aminotransferase